MFVLFETPSGLAIFKTTEDTSIDIQIKNLKLVSFSKYKNLQVSLKANVSLSKGKIPKPLKKALKKHFKDNKQRLVVYDKKLGNSITKKHGIPCVYGPAVEELLREIRSNFDKYTPGEKESDLSDLKISLSHSICTQKIKFSPDKVDLMIIQAISLIDDIDKELNTYLMRIKEWYGWHFPELVRIVSDNDIYVKLVIKIGSRKNEIKDLSDLVDEDTEEKIRTADKVSMGTDIGEEDEKNIKIICQQYLEISEYRTTLFEYLKNRMAAIAPNLTEMVGELIGARLIAKAGSLLNLAKAPSSTIQIFGAEKALFRAIKSKSNPPKYGLIYHAKLIGKEPVKKKGKAARVLAAKVSLATRVDAFSENGVEGFAGLLKSRYNKQLGTV